MLVPLKGPAMLPILFLQGLLCSLQTLSQVSLWPFAQRLPILLLETEIVSFALRSAKTSALQTIMETHRLGNASQCAKVLASTQLTLKHLYALYDAHTGHSDTTTLQYV